MINTLDLYKKYGIKILSIRSSSQLRFYPVANRYPPICKLTHVYSESSMANQDDNIDEKMVKYDVI